MNNVLFIVLIALFLFTNVVRLIYEVLKYKKRIFPNRINYICIFINMITMFTAWFIICSIDNSYINFPYFIRLIGFLLFLAGLVFVIISRIQLKTFEVPSGGKLIKTGIYAKIRHPMYLGFLLWALGLPIYFGGLYSLILAFPFVANILFWRNIEQIELIKIFPEYKDYMRKTLF